MDYYFKPSAIKDLRMLPPSARKRILEKLDFYFRLKQPLSRAKPIRDTLGEFRFRVGDYRVIFDVENGRAIILVIGHRKDIYK